MPLSTREMPKSEVKSEKKWKDMKKKIARRMSIGSRYLTNYKLHKHDTHNQSIFLKFCLT